jgi:hypothetical protein
MFKKIFRYHFPTIDELVILIEEVVKFYKYSFKPEFKFVNQFSFDSFVGLGIGAGAHLMLKYAVSCPCTLKKQINLRLKIQTKSKH